MEWTNEHDLIFLREMLASDVFHSRKGSPERGKIWDEITERLNSTQAVSFRIKDKRGTRDRWNLLQSKFKKKRREEQGASGIEVEEPNEKEQLIEELSEKEETATIETASAVMNGRQDKEAAEDARKKALERLGETKKRKRDTGVDEKKERKTRRSVGNAVEFLREKAQEELALRRQDQQLQQQSQQQQLLQQQQMMQLVQTQNEQMQAFQQQSQQQQLQQNQMLIALLQKIIPR